MMETKYRYENYDCVIVIHGLLDYVCNAKSLEEIQGFYTIIEPYLVGVSSQGIVYETIMGFPSEGGDEQKN